MKKIGICWEKYYPWILPLPIVLVVCLVMRYFNISCTITEFDYVLSGVINFSSICIGFTGTMLAVLATIRDSVIIKEISKQGHNETIKNFTNMAIISGVIVIGLSCILYLEPDSFIKIAWATILVFFALCEYRIIGILIKILFLNPPINTSSNRVDDQKMNQLMNKHRVSREDI